MFSGGAALVSQPVLDRNQRSEAARAARREEILEAARRVFAARGFGGTTIADIAEEASIALGTIYLYFPSKEAVFAALHQRFVEMVREAFQNVPQARSLDETVRRRVDRVFEACTENSDLVRLVVLNMDPESRVTQEVRRKDDERIAPMARGLASAMAAGQIRTADPFVTAKLIYGVVSIAVYQALVVSDGTDADKYRQGCADMIIAYLNPPPSPASG